MYFFTEPGLGSLMREVENKICTDCEFIALPEEDNGMELLVNSKIISLDLPVEDVYQKVGLPESGEGDPMTSGPWDEGSVGRCLAIVKIRLWKMLILSLKLNL